MVPSRLSEGRCVCLPVVRYVTDDSSSCYETTLAAAGVCQLKGGNSGRPILGFMNICDLMFSEDNSTHVSTLLHELMHALVRRLPA